MSATFFLLFTSANICFFEEISSAVCHASLFCDMQKKWVEGVQKIWHVFSYNSLGKWNVLLKNVFCRKKSTVVRAAKR